MPVKKISVALEAEVATAASESAERQGLTFSAWLNNAAENALAIDRGLAAVREWEAENGPLTSDELQAADAILDGKPKGGAQQVA